jgi:hypothetical protein
MPAKSEKQRKMMGAALGRKRAGKSEPDDPKMSTGQLRDFAAKAVSSGKGPPMKHGKHHGKPHDKKHHGKKGGKS